ncbi:MAG: signal recognition particle-docking protein FtsY [Caulobacterales bacterium]
MNLFGKKSDDKPQSEAPAEKDGMFGRLFRGLGKSSARLSDQVSAVFVKKKLDEETLAELEELLIAADLGVPPSMRIIETLRNERVGRETSDDEIKQILAREIAKVLKPRAASLDLSDYKKPAVLLFVGVNGSGKTTTIGKIAAKLAAEGKKVTIAAGDTFRAAAIDQLRVWAERANATFISSKQGGDSAGIAFEAMEKAIANGSDVLLIDTAGRLQNKSELMVELNKITRVLRKIDDSAPHEAILVLDATVGQNALSQAEAFRSAVGISGLVMTKLDGTAKGGVLVALASAHALPIYFIGVGESAEDLQPFDAESFAHALVGLHV